MSDYGTPKYIDFRFGAVEAWIRCDEKKNDVAIGVKLLVIASITVTVHDSVS